jgi:hypothetical protein
VLDEESLRDASTASAMEAWWWDRGVGTRRLSKPTSLSVTPAKKAVLLDAVGCSAFLLDQCGGTLA